MGSKGLFSLFLPSLTMRRWQPRTKDGVSTNENMCTVCHHPCSRALPINLMQSMFTRSLSFRWYFKRACTDWVSVVLLWHGRRKSCQFWWPSASRKNHSRIFIFNASYDHRLHHSPYFLRTGVILQHTQKPHYLLFIIPFALRSRAIDCKTFFSLYPFPTEW